MYVVNRWILPINFRFHCIGCMLYRVIDYIESIRRILFMSLSTSVIYRLVDNDFILILVYTFKNKCFLLLITWAIFRYDLFRLCTLSFKRKPLGDSICPSSGDQYVIGYYCELIVRFNLIYYFLTNCYKS